MKNEKRASGVTMKFFRIRLLKLSFLLLFGVIAALPLLGAECPETDKDKAVNLTTSVMIVVDGSPDPPVEIVKAIVEKLRSQLGAGVSSRIMRFDMEPGNEAGINPGKDSCDTLAIAVRTALRDAVPVGIKSLAGTLTPRRAMVIIAANEFYGSSISRRRLVDTAREQEIPVYSIVVLPPNTKKSENFFSRFGRTLGGMSVWLIEALIQEESSPSISETSRLLDEMARATGARSCTASDQDSGLDCAKTIADEIKIPR